MVAPVIAAEPKAEPSALPEAGRGKAKHLWHSPALSARYGELPYDEPRYKPRIPDADQGALSAPYRRPIFCSRPRCLQKSEWCLPCCLY